ncbi:hypothetical protein PUN28_014280 [Cardiocondyla obscurior]|uniref:Uncharacterized protein n=1 Tax=Cardiocondyla obscurior TaxID=286306 RepID=A0AAW2F1S5_9HYME
MEMKGSHPRRSVTGRTRVSGLIIDFLKIFYIQIRTPTMQALPAAKQARVYHRWYLTEHRLRLRNDQLGSSYADLFTGVIFGDDEASLRRAPDAISDPVFERFAKTYFLMSPSTFKVWSPSSHVRASDTLIIPFIADASFFFRPKSKRPSDLVYKFVASVSLLHF